MAAFIGKAGDVTLQHLHYGARSEAETPRRATSDAAAGFSDVLKDVVGDRVRIVRFPSQDELHRVRVGPIGDLEEASRLEALIITADLGVPLIIYD